MPDDGFFELLGYSGEYTCDGCNVLYGGNGWRIISTAPRPSQGNSRIAIMCDWCLVKLAIRIMERKFG